MRQRLCFVLFLLVFCGPVRAQPLAPKNISVYFSPGSNNVRGDLIPLSSPQCIDEAFDGAQKTFGVTRVLWRGLQEEDYARHEEFRTDNLWLYDIWQWSRHLSLELKLNRHAVRAAHRRGMAIWGLTCVFEFGAEPREGVYAAMELGPAISEDRLRVRHRDWIPVDRYGIRRQTGPLESAYPQARRALREQLVKEVLRYDYDGLMLLTYVENTDQWFEDEFGFSEPVVQEFQRRYGVDIRTQVFDVSQWRKLRGEYFTLFLRELAAALHAKGKKLGIAVDPRRPDRPQPWLGNSIPTANAGSLEMDWEVWVREGIVDEVMIGAPGAAAEFAARLQSAKSQAGVAISVLCHPLPPGEALREQFFPGCTPVISGSVPAFETEVTPQAGGILAARRRVQGLTARGAEALPEIEGLLHDKNHAVRVAAVIALRKIYDADTPAHIFQAAASGNAQFNYEAAQSLSRMKAEATPALVAGLDAPSLAARHLAVETLRQGEVRLSALPPLLPALRDNDVWIRWGATISVARLIGENPNTEAVVTRALLSQMNDTHPTVRAAAASALGGVFSGGRGDAALRSQVRASLTRRFGEFGTHYRSADAEWGFKTPGRALQVMGAEGEDILKKFLQSSDATVADHAWRTLYLPPSSITTSVQTAEAAREYYKLHPQSRRRMVH